MFVADIDECENIPNVCENGRCVNTEAGYFCVCDVGFELSPDKKACIGELSLLTEKVNNIMVK